MPLRKLSTKNVDNSVEKLWENNASKGLTNVAEFC